MTNRYFIEKDAQTHLSYRVGKQEDYPYGDFEEVAAFRNPNDANKFVRDKNKDG